MRDAQRALFVNYKIKVYINHIQYFQIFMGEKNAASVDRNESSRNSLYFCDSEQCEMSKTLAIQ